MKYRNGKDILPKALLEQLQKYVQGELVYIPRQESQRAGWGAVNGARLMIRMRNVEICRLYGEGSSVVELMDMYHLSEDSIRKVLNSRTVLMVAIEEK